MSGRTLAEMADRGVIDAGWAEALAPVDGAIAQVEDRIRAERSAGREVLPRADLVFRAFRRPFADVRALVVGQDPYPTPGHAVGLSFAVDRDVRPIPRSLGNIYRELQDDVGVVPPAHGDLSCWADQGVMLLNRVLTVSPGQAASHRGWGWESVTDQAIRALAGRGGPLVAILWGAQARSLSPLLTGVACLESAHPSPLSARRGFFGSRPFSRANEHLVSQGADPIDWTVI